MHSDGIWSDLERRENFETNLLSMHSDGFWNDLEL